MDTKSKKFKHSAVAKLLCFSLSAVLLASSACCITSLVRQNDIFGASGNIRQDFYSTQGFSSLFSSHLSAVVRTGVYNSDTSAFGSQENEIINEAVAQYLDMKAQIIHDELEYAATHYTKSNGNDEYSDYWNSDDPNETAAEPNTMVVVPEPTTDITGEERTTYLVDQYASENIQLAQQVLNTVTGRGFLEYAFLVREAAFYVEFAYSFDLFDYSGNPVGPYTLYADDLLMDEVAIRETFADQFYQPLISSYYLYDDGYQLATLTNLKFYVSANGEQVSGNLDAEPTEALLREHTVYAVFDGKAASTAGVSKSVDTTFKESLKSIPENIKIYVYLENSLEPLDVYSALYQTIAERTVSPGTLIFLIIITLCAAIALFVLFLNLCGHVNGKDTPVTAFIDRIPSDIHFLLTAGILAGGLILCIDTVSEMNALYPWGYFSDYALAIAGGVSFLGWCVLGEWIASVARMLKAGVSLWRASLLYKFFGIFRLICNALKYRPRRLKASVIAIIALYLLANIILITLALLMFNWASVLSIISVGLFLALNAAVFILAADYFQSLDKIIDASCKGEAPDFGGKKLPLSLKLLATNLADTGQRLSKAVEKAVKDEQLKTELITNVSHDLKTPLTSLISYSDLLRKCDIKDPDALKYINTLNEQSIKLKRLIEDLIEASKVSTGNVTLQKTKLNLSELAVQAIVEFTPEMEKNSNEIRFNEPETPPYIFADSSKTYRIISNLLSNAKKYSAPYTRIYVSIYSDGKNGFFEIKNVSSEPLDITPEELTERFVRGDKSRTHEGNGLGLSIAKDLCELQQGELKIFIDGDLFKVVVRLPSPQVAPPVPDETDTAEGDGEIHTEPQEAPEMGSEENAPFQS